MSYCINGKERVLGDGTFLPDKPKGPSDLKLRWDTSYKNARKSLRGPDPTWSYAGALPDGSGGVTDGSIPPLHGEDGVWLGPGYTNALPAGSEDLTDSSWNKRGVTAVLNADGSYRVTLAGAGTKDIYTLGGSFSNPHSFSIEAKLVSGSGSLYIKDSSGAGGVTEYTASALSSEFVRLLHVAADIGSGMHLHSDTNEVTVDLRFPQGTDSPYLFPYVPPGTSVTSAAGSTGDNGISFDLSGVQEVANGVELFTAPISEMTTNGVVDGETIILDPIEYAFESQSFEGGVTYEVTYFGSGSGAVRHATSGDNGTYPAEYSDLPITARITADAETSRVQIKGGPSGAVLTGISVQKIITAEEPLSKALRECYEGKADGVELCTNGDASDTTSTDSSTASLSGWTNYGTHDATNKVLIVDGTFNLLSDGTNVGLSQAITTSGQRYKYSIEITDVSSGTGVKFVGATDYTESINSVGVHTGTFIADSSAVVLQRVGGVTNISFTNISVQKLNPAISTTAALVKMGVGSDELADGDNKNVLSANDLEDNALSFKNIPRIVRSNDGTTILQSDLVSWDRNETHLKIVQQDGTNFRVGNKRYAEDGTEIDTDPVWSPWTAFDGSFDPLDALRLALNGTVPLWLKHLVVWDKVATEEEIERWAT